MVNVLRSSAIFLVPLLAAALQAQTGGILPLREVQPGMKAIGRSVFAGMKVEEFQVEILGVLENAGPKQSIILARLSGAGLEKTGVMQGMSGSPVYYNGRLMGAVALSFPFSKEPIAGIRPIEEMLTVSPSTRQTAEVRFPYDGRDTLPKSQGLEIGPQRLMEIATPFWLSGFTRNTIDYFAPALRAAGLEPVQGVSGGGRAIQAAGTAKTPLVPGAMISVQLVRGDLNVGADGTVTHLDGNRVYAFGHRFLAIGDTEMPFARSEVITLLASNNQSFKISTPREWLGSITQDRSVAISGELGKKADMIPLSMRVKSRGGSTREWSYKMEMVEDRLFTPLLVQMAVFSAIDATERSTGVSTITLRGQVLMDGAPAVKFDNIYAADLGAPQQVSAAIAAPVSAVLQSGFDALKLRGLDLEIEVSNEKKQLQLDSIWASQREVRPGEAVEITATFAGEHGVEITRTAKYQVPIGAPVGPLFFTVTDGPSANLSDFKQFLLTPPRSAPQLYDFLTGLHPNDRPYLRVWRSQSSWLVQGETMPSPPPSMAMALSHTATQQANALVASIEMPAAGFQFSGSKTVQVDVKE